MTHNRPIFHCECCGAVIRQELVRVPPFCCGKEMSKAGEETVSDDFLKELGVEPPLASTRLAPRWSEQQPEVVSR